MRPWFLSLAIVGLGGLVSAQPFVAPSPAPLGTPYVGAASCSASACHNHEPVRGIVGSEYGVWGSRDPHAKAYEVLFNDVAVRIQKSLGSATKPHEDRRCLQCHVGVELDDNLNQQIPYFRSDGVSCEVCHGPARQWLTTHYSAGWPERTPAHKRQLGMKDTKSVRGRVELCVSCHVGDVDHDLIAAGHPRLSFEFTAFHAAMPHHWRGDAKDFESKAWLRGQLMTTRAALNLLADRASDKQRPWPEFAEHDCAACHHDLGAAARKAGNRVPWSDWNLALTPAVLKAFDADTDALALLQKELANGWHDRQAIAAKARRAAAQIKPLFDRDEGLAVSERLLRDIFATPEQPSLDNLTQRALAVSALRRFELSPIAIQDFASRLTLPTGFAKSAVYPMAIRKRLIDFKAGKEE